MRIFDHRRGRIVATCAYKRCFTFLVKRSVEEVLNRSVVRKLSKPWRSNNIEDVAICDSSSKGGVGESDIVGCGFRKHYALTVSRGVDCHPASKTDPTLSCARLTCRPTVLTQYAATVVSF